MRKLLLVSTLFLLLSMYFVNSVTTFVYNETDFVSLQPEANDPDNHELIYTFNEPLNEKGEWQTTYGDAGKYETVITVSDGELSTSETILIVVNKKEMAPNIETVEPDFDDVEVTQTESLKFRVLAYDLNEDSLSYSWSVDGENVAQGQEFIFSPDYSYSGTYQVRVDVSDGLNVVSKVWGVSVKEIDLDSVLDSIEDITVTETEIVRLDLGFLKEYGLSYKISEPFGEDNYWSTDYDSEGEYDVLIEIEGPGFEDAKKVKVNVLNKDRPSEFDNPGFYFVKENNDMKIELKAQDPDGEEIEFEAESLPQGSSFKDNVFEFNPSYDFVNKHNAMDYVLDKFHLLGRIIDVNFAAVTENGRTQKNVKIIVYDNNRIFEIENLDDIRVKEGEIVKIEPKYTDPDNDEVKFTYSGWMNKNVYKTTYGDAGEYYVKVIGNDGYNSAYKFVKIIVEKSNRAPEFSKIKPVEVNENENVKFELESKDKDKDEIIFLAENLPEGAYLHGNIFEFTPNYDFVKRNKSVEEVLINFIASDKEEETMQSVTITVNHINRAPELVDASNVVQAKIGEPVQLSVNVNDPDNDNLRYDWKFGMFEKYDDSTALMERTFSSKGNKKVKVTVSDGFEEIEHEWNIKVE